LDDLRFDRTDPGADHAELGYRLLSTFRQTANAARIIRYHHAAWQGGAAAQMHGQTVPLGSHLLHVADRVSIGVAGAGDILQAAKPLTQEIQALAGRQLAPDAVEAFLAVSAAESFWFDLVSPRLGQMFPRYLRRGYVELDITGTMELARIFSQIIDFRSRFTATHSAGVAATGQELARLVGMSALERDQIRIAGLLHDLGKLAVPRSVLENPGKLTTAEFGIIKRHTYYTFRILEPLVGWDMIRCWAAFHHERLDGSGYPFRIAGDHLSLGARVMAVADVFTALTEHRPYRVGMSSEKALVILHRMEAQALDANLVSLLAANLSHVDNVRAAAQRDASVEFGEFFAKAPSWLPPGGAVPAPMPTLR
jgi:HD-GYP domain-containing protein (c-di-GMP phosphodiesterase class II)